MTQIAVDIATIKVDLAEHMRRTDLLEKQIAPLTRVYHFFQVLAAILAVGGTIAAIIKVLL